MAAIDEHMLTGEAQPVEKGVGDQVLAATIVLSGRLQVRVEKTGSETTAAKIGEVLNRNEEYRLATEQKAIAIAEKSLVPMLAAGAVALPLAGVSGMFAMLGSVAMKQSATTQALEAQESLREEAGSTPHRSDP